MLSGHLPLLTGTCESEVLNRPQGVGAVFVLISKGWLLCNTMSDTQQTINVEFMSESIYSRGGIIILSPDIAMKPILGIAPMNSE